MGGKLKCLLTAAGMTILYLLGLSLIVELLVFCAGIFAGGMDSWPDAAINGLVLWCNAAAMAAVAVVIFRLAKRGGLFEGISTALPLTENADRGAAGRRDSDPGSAGDSLFGSKAAAFETAAGSSEEDGARHSGCAKNKGTVRNRARLAPFFWLFALGLAAQFSISCFLTLLDAIPLFGGAMEAYSDTAAALEMGESIASFVVTVLAAPAAEEIAYRGLILGTLRRAFPARTALIIQAVLFGIMHGDLIQGAYAVILGLLLGHVYLYAKSLWKSVFLHAAVNFGSFLIIFLPEFMYETVPALFLSGCMFLIFGGFVLRKYEQAEKELKKGKNL